MKNRYWRDVAKVHKELTDEQLAEQVAKFWYSDISHEKGKLNSALEEIEDRKHGNAQQ